MTKLLILEDDLNLLNILGVYLERAGFEISKAHDIESALEALEKEKIDLLFTDCDLPDGRSWEKVIPMACSLGVAVVATSGDINNKKPAEDAGAVDFLSKPYKLSEVIQALKMALESIPG